MKLYLKNHTERYPVEQLQLQLFAQEPSEFCTEPFTGDGTVSSLSRGKQFLTATAKVTYRGRTGFASNRVRLEDADVRATRRILQRSYYLAAMQVQFTLYGDVSHGRRPSFIGAAKPDLAIPLYEQFLAECERLGFPPQHGEFGAYMQVSSENDGPVTLIVDTDDLK